MIEFEKIRRHPFPNDTNGNPCVVAHVHTGVGGKKAKMLHTN